MTTPTIYAIVDSSDLCINTCIWDGVSEWTPPDGCRVVQIPEGTRVGIGWSCVDGQFIAPEPEPEQIEEAQPTEETS